MASLSTYFKGQDVPVKRLSYQAGSAIFSEADQANGMYIIESGQVKITKKAPKTQGEITLATLGPEDFLGVLSFTSGRNRLADAIALTDCTLWEIDKKAFEEAVDRCPEFSLFLINGLTRRLGDLHKRMGEMSEQLKEFTVRFEDISSLWQSLVPMGG